MMLRRGREVYSKHYEEALKLHSQGLSVQEIASKLNVSYSAAYHWIKGLRKPEAGNVNEFLTYLQTTGPRPVVDLKEKFPKHNELFLIAARRSLPVKRHMLPKKYKDYSIWYYLPGQEKDLEERIDQLLAKVKEVRKKLRSSL